MRGHIKQRSKGSWAIWVELGRDPTTGRRRQQTVTVRGTKKDAERRLSEQLNQLDTGIYVSPQKLTVVTYLGQWLESYARSHVRPRTYDDYRGIVRVHLTPCLGSILLTELRPHHLSAYYADRLASGRMDGKPKPLSANSVAHHHRILHEALAHAVKLGLLARNVAEAVDPPRFPRREMAVLSADGLNRLLEAAKDTPYHTLFLLAAHTGMRRSELLGLQWGDVDLEMATLSVVRVLHQLNDGRIIYNEPKTAKGRRLVALTPTAAVALRAHKERREADCALLGITPVSSEPVFCHVDGSPLLPDTISQAFAKLTRRLGLGRIRFHDLRHSHASLMLAQNVHPKIVSERLGHSTVSITLDLYSHVTPGLQEAAALRFDDGLRSAPVSRPVSNPLAKPEKSDIGRTGLEPVTC